MASHEFEQLGGWGSKQVSIAGYRCFHCGFTYIDMNLAADPTARIFPISANGEELPPSALSANCPSRR